MSAAVDERFAPGEVVQLKSGGPFMTVIGISEDGDRLGCGWFWSGRYQTDIFTSHQLKQPSGEALRAATNLKTPASAS